METGGCDVTALYRCTPGLNTAVTSLPYIAVPLDLTGCDVTALYRCTPGLNTAVTSLPYIAVPLDLTRL
jgi:phosphoribosylcarboxyaminoimidazole (NCAIR) mutase